MSSLARVAKSKHGSETIVAVYTFCGYKDKNQQYCCITLTTLKEIGVVLTNR